MSRHSLGLWVGGSSLSLLGDQVYSVASTWSASTQGGAAGATAVALAVTAPRLVFMVLGGPVADRLGPAAVLLRADAARAVLMMAACMWIAVSGADVMALVVVGLPLGALSGLAAGASGAMLPQLVEDDGLARANSVNMLATRGANIVGSLFAGYLIAGPGLAVVMALNAVTFCVSFTCVRIVREAAAAPADGTSSPAPFWQDATRGYGYVVGDRGLRWMILSGLIMELGFSWSINAGIAPLAQTRGWGPYSLAATLATFAAAAALSTLVGAWLKDHAAWSRVIVGQVIMGGGLLMMTAADQQIALWFSGSIILGIGSGQVGPMLITLVQRRTDPARMGVSMAAISVAGLGSVSISIAIFGAVASVVDPKAAWWASAGLVLMAPLASAVAAKQHIADRPVSTVAR